ncbi:MAG: desulfoferrodoxin [Candidatus Pacearchaeota archaeon]|jgi:superoxide reductase
MTIKRQIWKCEICGNIIEVLHEGADALVCCGEKMKLQKENTVDASLEKHVPIIENKGQGHIIVKVGSVPHPMTDEHYIEWIEVLCDLGTFKYFLNPGNKPEAEFYLGNIKKFTVRAYCNLHGLWKAN